MHVYYIVNINMIYVTTTWLEVSWRVGGYHSVCRVGLLCFCSNVLSLACWTWLLKCWLCERREHVIFCTDGASTQLWRSGWVPAEGVPSRSERHSCSCVSSTSYSAVWKCRSDSKGTVMCRRVTATEDNQLILWPLFGTAYSAISQAVGLFKYHWIWTI